jgi:hypothetical protein
MCYQTYITRVNEYSNIENSTVFYIRLCGMVNFAQIHSLCLTLHQVVVLILNFFFIIRQLQ